MTRLSEARGRDAGFTLIEVLAATLLTSIVIGVAVALYINLTKATTTATARTRTTRNAMVILDRVARDLEGAFLLAKPAEVDPLEHPWLFLGESREMPGGSDRLKFVTRNYRSASTEEHTSDVGLISYALYAEDGDLAHGFDLVRWNSSRLPEGLDRTIPMLEEDGAILVADGIDHFSVRFMDAGGAWVEEWDSSQIENSGTLPIAAEVRVALIEDSLSANPDAEPEIFSRRVVLPIRPLPIDLIVEQAIAIAAAAQTPGSREKSELEKKYEDAPPATDCEMTFLECFDIPKNTARAQQQLGTGDAFYQCRGNVAQMPVCVEEYPAAMLCGVPIECWYD